MLSFKALYEKKTKVTINPKLKDVMEKKGTCAKTGDAVCKCDEKTPAQKSICPVCRGTGKVDGKPCPACSAKNKSNNPMEEQAYVSQEEVSEKSDQSIDQEETSTLLTFSQFNERTRYAKETGKDPQTGNESKKGGTMKGSAMAAVRKDLVKSGGLMSSRKKPINPQGKKQVKGVKSDVGTGKYKKMADNKKAQADKAKKAGFKNTQSYADTMARYGGEDNYKKGRGLGS